MDKVLIIDDSGAERKLLHTWLRGCFHVIEANSTEFAEAQIKEEQPICIIIDLNMPQQSGFLFIHKLSKSLEKIPAIILMSGVLEESMKRNAIALGAAYCFEKDSMDKDTLINLILKVTQRKSA